MEVVEESRELVNPASIESRNKAERIDALSQFDNLIASDGFEELFEQPVPVKLTIV